MSIAVSPVTVGSSKVDRNGAAHVVGEADVKVRVAALKGHRHDVAERGFVDFDGIVILQSQELDRGVVIDFVGHLADAVVDLGADVICGSLADP
jgi:phosphopantothenate synthetase